MQRSIPLAGLCLAIFLVMAGMGLAAVALPEAYLRLAGSTDSSGWLAASFAMAYVACQYPAGRWADLFGFRPVIASGCLLVAAAAAIFLFASSPEAIYLGRFVQGAGEAPLWAAAPALLGRLYPERRGRVMGLYNAVFHLGMMSGPLLGAWAASRAGFDPFAAFAAASLAAGILVLACLRGAEPRAVRGRARPRARLVPDRGLWPLAVALPVYGAAYGLLVSCLPVALAADPAVGRRGLALFLFTAFAGIAVAQYAAGALSDRFGRGVFMALGLVLAGAGLAAFTASGPGWGLTACAAVLGLGLGAFAVASMALVGDNCPRDCKGAASGLYYLVWGLGYFAGPLAVDAAGLRMGTGAMACAAWAAAGCVAAGALARRRKMGAGHP